MASENDECHLTAKCPRLSTQNDMLLQFSYYIYPSGNEADTEAASKKYGKEVQLAGRISMYCVLFNWSEYL